MCRATCRVRRVAWSGRRTAAAIAALGLSLAGPAIPLPVDAATATTVSAIGDEVPLWMAVSPQYARTHMVAAIAAPMSRCTPPCRTLWITRDGGGSWRGTRLPFDASYLVVVGNGADRESVVTTSSTAVERSDDDGATWTVLGPAGIPAADGDGVVVAVPRGQDYVALHGTQREVPGSDGTELDLAFAGAGRGGLLAAGDPSSGADVVMRCDASFGCASPSPMAGAQGADVSLSLAGDFPRSGVAVARTSRGLYRSTDGGHTFVPITVPATGGASYTAVSGVALTPAGDTMYVATLSVVDPGGARRATTGGGVDATTDGGATWHRLGGASPLDGGASAVVAAPDLRVFAGYVTSGGRSGLLCNQDGVRWRATCDPLAVACARDCAVATRGTTAPRTPAPHDADAATVNVAKPAAPLQTPAVAPLAAPSRAHDGGGPSWSAAARAAALGAALVGVILRVSTRRRRRR